MTTFFQEMTLDLYGHIDLEDVPCTVQATVETFPAEPYSWGGARGTETEVSVRITDIKLGRLTLTRAQAIAAFGDEALERAEAAAADSVHEEVKAA